MLLSHVQQETLQIYTPLETANDHNIGTLHTTRLCMCVKQSHIMSCHCIARTACEANRLHHSVKVKALINS